jgi:hypothetical protein
VALVDGGPAAVTDELAGLLHRLDEMAAKHDERRAILLELQQPPTTS